MLIEFEKLGLENKLNKKSFTYNGQEIEVLQYLPIEEKVDLIAAVLKEADKNGIYDPILMDMYFHWYIINYYTNISFVESREDMTEVDFYDILYTNGIIEKVVSLMNEEEYQYIFEMLNNTKEEICRYRHTLAGVIRGAIESLPQNAEKAVEILQNLDPEQFQELTDIANTLNNIPGLMKN